MEIHLTRPLRRAFPSLEDDISFVTTKVKNLVGHDTLDDRLYIEGRCSRYGSGYSGMAYPYCESKCCGCVKNHEDGKITFTLGRKTSLHDLFRVVSHELFHINQFHKGRQEFGFMTIHPQSVRESEREAFDFEDRFLDYIEYAV